VRNDPLTYPRIQKHVSDEEKKRIRESYVRQLLEGFPMHYKNGRAAKNGDKVFVVPSFGPPYVGILYDAVAGNDHCNGRVAPILPNDPCPNLKEALHLDDAMKALPASVPDSTSAPA
jgi:hypothetical protein